jgi:hypothetical protein
MQPSVSFSRLESRTLVRTLVGGGAIRGPSVAISNARDRPAYDLEGPLKNYRTRQLIPIVHTVGQWLLTSTSFQARAAGQYTVDLSLRVSEPSSWTGRQIGHES